METAIREPLNFKLWIQELSIGCIQNKLIGTKTNTPVIVGNYTEWSRIPSIGTAVEVEVEKWILLQSDKHVLEKLQT